MKGRALGVAAFAMVLAVAAPGSDVVVLKGGERIELQSPPRQQGNNVLLTRADGTLLSVPLSEIDMKATADARKAARKPEPTVEAVAQTPAEAARSGREGPKAKVRVTDADVAHETVQAEAGDGAPGEKKDAPKGVARLDVVGYDQSRAGASLIVRGSLRNVGGTHASNSRLTVTALDQNGDVIGTGEGSLSKGSLDPFETVAFTASVPIGEKIVGSLRFQPQWLSAPPPASPAEAAAAQKTAATASQTAAGQAPAAAANQPPAPTPTPYGFGLYYAPPIPPAAIGTPPADGKTGYIPAPSDPASQPKPPNL